MLEIKSLEQLRRLQAGDIRTEDERQALYPTSSIRGNVKGDPRTLREAFEEFHRTHPFVYDRLVNFARQKKAEGFKKYSVHTIWELLRWHTLTPKKGNREFKLNDHHVPYYARLIMRRELDLTGFFDIRPLAEEK